MTVSFMMQREYIQDLKQLVGQEVTLRVGFIIRGRVGRYGF